MSLIQKQQMIRVSPRRDPCSEGMAAGEDVVDDEDRGMSVVC